MTLAIDEWRRWIGREERIEEVMDPARARALHATLERPGPAPAAGDPLPPLWHWIYFWSISPMSGLGADGHPTRGRFLPPIDLTRRMWAGSRFVFHRPLSLGKTAERRAAIAEVQLKQGRSGPLAFVTVRHEYSDAAGLCLEEQQDLVFRDPDPSGRRPAPIRDPADRPALWRRPMTSDPVLLFRYSALTFNGHRIHYDPAHAAAEGYAGLVVHGPLLGTLMLQLALDAQPAAAAARYRFRLLHPLSVSQGFSLCGRPSDEPVGAELWVEGPDGAPAAEASLRFA